MQGGAYIDSDLGRLQGDIEGRLERARRRLRTATIAGRPRAQVDVDSLERQLERVKQDRRERGEL